MEKRTVQKIVTTRLDEINLKRLERAASLSGETRAQFIRGAAMREAARFLKDEAE
ncbi:MAG: DUF1778 domain-containing protein [Cypionkella sp.]|nr:DUF1778 domain-containing protein [Cypionkella sp.]